MNQVDKKYWIELTIITALLVAAAYVTFIYLLPGHYPPALPAMLVTIVAVTAVGQVVLTRLLAERFSKFNSAFLIYKALKILILMAFMVVYSALNKEHALYFLGSTFVIYLVFMFFESRSLNRHSKKQAER